MDPFTEISIRQIEIDDLIRNIEYNQAMFGSEANAYISIRKERLERLLFEQELEDL